MQINIVKVLVIWDEFMSTRPLDTKQEELLYAASLLGFNTRLKLVEDKIRTHCNSKSNINEKDDCKIITLKKSTKK